MMPFVRAAFATALLAGTALSASADAQPIHRHAHRTAPALGADGRQIYVEPRQSFLTLGTGADVGAYNSYALWTISPLNRMPEIDNTNMGQRGRDRLPNNLTV